MSGDLAGFTIKKSDNGQPYLDLTMTSQTGTHRIQVGAPNGFAFEEFAGKPWIVTRGATVYLQPQGLDRISLPKGADTKAMGQIAVNYGIGEEFLSRPDKRPSIQSNDETLAKVGLGLATPPLAKGGGNDGLILGGALVFGALLALGGAIAWKFRKSKGA